VFSRLSRFGDDFDLLQCRDRRIGIDRQRVSQRGQALC